MQPTTTDTSTRDAVASTTTSPVASLENLASQTKTDRNRAVDLYRVIAMMAVAIGHWVAVVAYRQDGELITGSALEFVPSLAPLTWLLQVMPLFFMVGGFASAASLDSKGATAGSTPGRRRADWTASRLARLLPPVAALAATWLGLIGFGYLTDNSDLINAGAIAAAIPLWFLANYTADVIIAPYVLPLFRSSPKWVALGAICMFLALEIIRMQSGHAIAQINWILGWFLFQMAGFAWKDGLLPTGASMARWSMGLWAAAISLVTFGPWPVTMVSIHGIAHDPTHPPTLSLFVFGAAQSATAIYFAPRVTAWLGRNSRAWRGVVAANSFAMTVYLWHMTAAVAVLAVWDAIGILPSAAPGTAGWWVVKIPFVAVCVMVLAVVVPRLSKIEQKALLAPKGDWPLNPHLLTVGAVAVSVALKIWTSGTIELIIPALVVVIVASGAVRLLLAVPETVVD